ncbi:ATP-binding protein [Thermococcus barophilus]|uniref:Putative ATPase n=1 Tax=Thermococcus barophilus TaxID=55802 RepID=A0A0S1XBU7_THEBA|nr:ATP-binding protein [Thermococcus barophilus]ALM75250.1 putative ATPase [Thermococcus barophilus]
MYEQFVNRENELEALRKAYISRRKELIIVYGRRRVGKTALVQKSVKSLNHIYFFAEETLEEENLLMFRKLTAEVLGNPIIAKAELSWEELFELLDGSNVIVIIDEFPNLIKSNRAIISKFQKIWDSSKNLKLVLTGSSISIMESQVLGYKSPLYGRRTLSIKLEPLKFFHLREFFPEKSWEELVRIYGITDGIPAYIKEVQFRLSAGEKLEGVFQPNKPLFDEAEFLLRTELREPARYFAILKAIAFGKTKFGDIVSFTGLPSSTVSQYLSNLQTLHIVEEKHPVRKPERRRNARYYLSDLYFNFWFRFVYPNRSQLLEFGYIENFEEEYNQYLGFVFEKVVEQFLRELNRREKLPFKFTKIGKWWHKNEEIDLVALNEREKKALFVEVKWKELSEREARGVLKDLERKAELVGLDGWTKAYGLVAKSLEGKEKLRSKGWLVWDLEDFERLIEKKDVRK